MFKRNIILKLPADWAVRCHIEPCTEKSILQSFAPAFREYILGNIKEDIFAVLYSKGPSRPNIAVNQAVGSGILMAFEDIPQKQFFDELMANYIHRFALDLISSPEEDFEGKHAPLVGRSYQRFINKNIRYRELTGIDLIHICLNDLFSKLAVVMEVNGRIVRMDSMLIHAYCRSLTRHELLYVCNVLVVKELVARSFTLPDFAMHYSDSDDRNNVLYRDINQDYKKTVATLIEDAHRLIQFCVDNRVGKFEAYKVLVRVFNEQTIEDENGTYRLRTSEDGGMNSTMVQTPFDLDATYRVKNGEGSKGYVANLIEAFGGWGTMILGYEYEQNIHSDMAFFKDYLNECNKNGIYVGTSAEDYKNFPYLEDLEEKYEEWKKSHGEDDPKPVFNPVSAPKSSPTPDDEEEKDPVPMPDTDEFLGKAIMEILSNGDHSYSLVVTDGAYYSVSLATQALQQGILHIPTNLTGIPTHEIYSQFVFNTDGTKVLKCPAGYEPKSFTCNSKTKACTCHFEHDHCCNCPHYGECKPKALKNGMWSVCCSQAKKIRALFQSFRNSNQFSFASRFRNGVETLPSILRRHFHVDCIPVRGLFRSSVRFGFDVAGLNFQKLLNGLKRMARNDPISLNDYTKAGREAKKQREAEEKAKRKEERAARAAERERLKAERAAERTRRKEEKARQRAAKLAEKERLKAAKAAESA